MLITHIAEPNRKLTPQEKEMLEALKDALLYLTKTTPSSPPNS